jgi:uncharacterized protein (TIGR03437 family)
VASYSSDQRCVAGSFATLVGSGFAAKGTEQIASGATLPSDLTGLQVRINDAAVPLLYASDTAINFECPNLPVNTSLTIVVQPPSGPSSDPIEAVMGEASPGIFMLNAAYQGAVLIASTGQVAMPTSDALPSRPAKPGEFLSIYSSGVGPLQEVLPEGSPAPLDHTIQTTDPVTVVIGGVEVTPAFSGLAPGQVGLYQVNIQLPDGVPTGNAVQMYLKVTLRDGSVLTSNTVTIAVQGPAPATGASIAGKQ